MSSSEEPDAETKPFSAPEDFPLTSSGRSWRVEHRMPASGILKYIFARIWLWLFGWKTPGHFPDVKRAVFIAHPHTSYWDLPHTLACAWVHRVHFNWLGKHTLFRNPISRWFFTTLGGIPVDRSAPQGLVCKAAEMINEAPSMMLVVPPAGTRSKRDYWKSGFYYIALTAKVPIVLGTLDFAKKEGTPGIAFYPTGNVKKDMDFIREYYKDARGKWPECETTIYLKDEAKYDEDGELLPEHAEESKL